MPVYRRQVGDIGLSINKEDFINRLMTDFVGCVRSTDERVRTSEVKDRCLSDVIAEANLSKEQEVDLFTQLLIANEVEVRADSLPDLDESIRSAVWRTAKNAGQI